MSRIIDAHSHYMPPDVAQNTSFFKAHWSDIEAQLKAMDAAGIEKSLLLYPTSDAHINMGGWQKVCDAYNKGIEDIIKKFPDRFIGAGILPIDQPEHFTDELKKMKDAGLKVISMGSSYDGKYLDDKMFDCVYDFAQKNNMPVHVHPQIIAPIGSERVQDPLLSPVLEYVFDVTMSIGKLMMEGKFLAFPDVKFIFAHFGGVLPLLKERFDTTYHMLRSRDFVKDLKQSPSDYFKNLYFDTSGSKSIASLQCMLEVTDSSHILFGSDYPANRKLAEAIEVAENAGLGPLELNKVLAGNMLEMI